MLIKRTLCTLFAIVFVLWTASFRPQFVSLCLTMGFIVEVTCFCGTYMKIWEYFCMLCLVLVNIQFCASYQIVWFLIGRLLWKLNHMHILGCKIGIFGWTGLRILTLHLMVMRAIRLLRKLRLILNKGKLSFDKCFQNHM